MTEGQCKSEIREVQKLLDEMEAMAHYQIAKAIRARYLLARLNGASDPIETVDRGRGGLAGHKHGESFGESSGA